MDRYLFTSESVTEGHPDKICDQISDAVLDAILEQDPNGRVACETVCTTGLVMVVGEITTKANIDIQELVRNKVKEIGYVRGKFGFDAENLAVLSSLHKQSPDIAIGVDDDVHEQGAGDQGIMFGYACDETEELMPLALSLSHRLARRLSVVRKENILGYLRPDGKTQVTVEYNNEGIIERIDTILISTQHSEDVTQEKIKQDLIKHVINEVVPAYLIDAKTKILVNPTGRFVIGGPAGDSGLTGRKIIVDTYGGASRHGGGAFSGKDPSKVDRSAAYMARYIAKNIVASGIAKKCEIQLSYAIGVAEPTSIMVDTFNTSNVLSSDISRVIRENFNLTPKGIIDTLDLKRPIYAKTAAYGHFGRTDIELPWEKLDKVSCFKELIK